MATTSPPSVFIQSPPEGATVAGTINIVATVADESLRSQDPVTWQVDSGPSSPMAAGPGSWTASWNTTSYSDGAHAITVRAVDSQGQSTSASVRVTVNNGAAQTLLIRNGDMAVTLQEKGSGSKGKVQGQWSGSATDAFSGTADASGIFVDWSNATDKVGTVVFTATVTNVSKNGWVWDSARSDKTESASRSY